METNTEKRKASRLASESFPTDPDVAPIAPEALTRLEEFLGPLPKKQKLYVFREETRPNPRNQKSWVSWQDSRPQDPTKPYDCYGRRLAIPAKPEVPKPKVPKPPLRIHKGPTVSGMDYDDLDDEDSELVSRRECMEESDDESRARDKIYYYDGYGVTNEAGRPALEARIKKRFRDLYAKDPKLAREEDLCAMYDIKDSEWEGDDEDDDCCNSEDEEERDEVEEDEEDDKEDEKEEDKQKNKATCIQIL